MAKNNEELAQRGFEYTMAARTDGSTRMDVTVGEAFGIPPGGEMCIVCLAKGPHPVKHKPTCPYAKRP